MSDDRSQQQVGLPSEVKGYFSGIYGGNADQADNCSCNCSKHAKQKALGHEQDHNFAGQCTNGGNGADFINPLIYSHDHHIHYADQNNGHKHDFNEKGHEVNHFCDIVKRCQLFPGVQFKYRLILLVFNGSKLFLEPGKNRWKIIHAFKPDCYFTDFNAMDAQQLPGII